MDNLDKRELLMAIAAVVIGLVVLVAVLSAGYVLLSALLGGPSPSPSPAPVPSETPTTYVVVPSGPLVPSGTLIPGGTPSSTYLAPTAVRPVVKSAELAGFGTDNDTYNRGDTATVYFIIKNTGTVPIDEAKLHISVARYVSMIGYVNVQTSDKTLASLNIQPGDTKRAEYAITIPSDYQGVSTAGKYTFTVDVIVWDVRIDTFTKEVQVL